MATVDEIIANAIAIANSEKDAADSAAQSAMAAASGYASLAPSLITFNVSAKEPAVPEVGNSTSTYEAQLDKMVALLSGQLANFFATYYPLAADAFDEATNWLLNSITNGGTGLSAAIEAQIYARGRERVITEGQRIEAQIRDDFASRGFSLPPGAMAAMLKQTRHAQLAATGNLARDTAIRMAEIEVENIRFSITQAIQSRQMAMQAAADYIRSIMSSPDAAARVAMLNSDVRAKMISATSDLYRARLSRDELILKAQEANMDAGVRAGAINVQGYYQGVDARVRAAVGAAGVYGNAAGAALSSLNSLVSSAEVTNL